MNYHVLRISILFFFPVSVLLSACSENVSESKIIEEYSETERELVPTSIIQNFNKSFKGKINNQYDIVMNLQLEGEVISGDYYYTKYNDKIVLKGTFTNEDNNFTIDEFTDGEKTGTFSGEINTSFALNGFWTSFSKASGREKPLPFVATESKEEFVWYSNELPFHPYQVAQILGMGDSGPSVDISEPVILPENYIMYENKATAVNGYTIEYEEGFVMRTPYFEYHFLGQEGNLYFVRISECGGGTGIFSGISILELNGAILKQVKSIAGGDRCNSGISEASYTNGKVLFSQNITPVDLYFMADSTLEKPQLSLESCAICCVGVGNFEYNLKTGEYSFVSFESSMENYDVIDSEPSDLDIFYHHLYLHIEKNEGSLNQQQLDVFIQDVINKITE